MTNKELYRKLRNYSGPNKKMVKAYIKGYENAKRDGKMDIAYNNLASAFVLSKMSPVKSTVLPDGNICFSSSNAKSIKVY